MAEGDGGGRRSRPKPSKLTIEEYLDFIHSHKQLDLTVDHLNQIIDMHGFNKIYKTHKRTLIEVVKSLELMDPSRSTLQDDGVSSDAFLSLNDVISDLNKLEWQECCITSLQTLNSVNIHDHLHQQYVGESLNNGGSGGGGASAGTCIVSAASEKPKRSRRKIRKLAQIGGGMDSVSAGLSFDGLETASYSSPAANMMSWGPRKKRTVNYVSLSGNGGGGVVNFGLGVAASVAGVPPQAEPPASESASPIVVLDAENNRRLG